MLAGDIQAVEAWLRGRLEGPDLPGACVTVNLTAFRQEFCKGGSKDVFFPREWVPWLLDELHWLIESATEAADEDDSDLTPVVGFGVIGYPPNPQREQANGLRELRQYIKEQL